MNLYELFKNKVDCKNIGGLRSETNAFLETYDNIISFELSFIKDEYFISFSCEKINESDIDVFIYEYINFIKYDFCFFLQKETEENLSLYKFITCSKDMTGFACRINFDIKIS